MGISDRHKITAIEEVNKSLETGASAPAGKNILDYSSAKDFEARKNALKNPGLHSALEGLDKDMIKAERAWGHAPEHQDVFQDIRKLHDELKQTGEDMLDTSAEALFIEEHANDLLAEAEKEYQQTLDDIEAELIATQALLEEAEQDPSVDLEYLEQLRNRCGRLQLMQQEAKNNLDTILALRTEAVQVIHSQNEQIALSIADSLSGDTPSQESRDPHAFKHGLERQVEIFSKLKESISQLFDSIKSMFTNLVETLKITNESNQNLRTELQEMNNHPLTPDAHQTPERSIN